MFIGVFVGVNVGVKNDKKWAFPGSFALAGSGCCVIGSQTRRLFSLASRVRMASLKWSGFSDRKNRFLN